MKDETIEDQNALIAVIEEAGYSVTPVEVRELEYIRKRIAKSPT